MTGEARRVVVVIDDLRTFAFDAVHARTSAQGIDVLRSCLDGGQAIDELWLDYNLGRGDTGSVVVAWLVTHADEMVPLVGRVNVHSSDPGWRPPHDGRARRGRLRRGPPLARRARRRAPLTPSPTRP